MTDISDSHSPPAEADIRAGVRMATGLLAVLGLLHAWASWGYAGPMWSAHGTWLHALERFADGQAPYRDFAWSNPPLALWLHGNIARVTGTSIAAISFLTTLTYFGILYLLSRIVQRLTPEVALSVTLTTLLFATAYAASSGVPLPLGTAAIGDTLGAMFLLGAVVAALDLALSRSTRDAALVGVLAGLSFASTQELWLAAVYVVLIGARVLHKDGSPRSAAALVAVFLFIVVTVFGWVFLRYGAGPRTMMQHSALIPAAIETTLPTAERLVIEAATVSAFTLLATTSLWLCLAISDKVAGRWAGSALLVFLCSVAVHSGMSVSKGVYLSTHGPTPYPGVIEQMLITAQRSGYGVREAALRILDDRFREHLFPILLPMFLLVVVFTRWRSWTNQGLRNQVAALLGLCLAARSSSGFRGTDWYNVLFEILTYVQMIRLGGELALRQAGRAVLAVLTTLMLIGAYTYFSQARGPFTLRGAWPETQTPRGPVRWEPWVVERYREIEAGLTRARIADRQPLLAFGPTGGWNYFLARPNPTPIVAGMHQLDSHTADSLMAALSARSDPVVLVDHPFFTRSEVVDIKPWFWQAMRGPSRYRTFDRPRFDRLLRDCTPLGAGDSTSVVWFHRCGQATR